MLEPMTEAYTPHIERPPVGNLTDFVVNDGNKKHLDIEVAIKEGAHVIVFHSHPFKKEVSWFEFDLRTNKLDFVIDNGDVRDIGLPLSKAVAVHMQNAHQILMVLMDPETGEASNGNYVPLIIHQS
ncbi:MAG: hypothetical protein WBK55_05110 [Alphaproteobacteria bacterium]